MPLTGNMRGLRGWAHAVAALGKPGGAPQRAIATAVGKEIRGILKQQFATSTSPTGSKWQPTVRGKPALVSKKLPGDFKTTPVAKGVATTSRIRWLRAHHDGHTFPARAQRLTFSQRGRLLSAKRQRKQKLVFDVDVTVKRRVLPARPIYPEHRMTDPWARGLNRGIAAGIRTWRTKAKI